MGVHNATVMVTGAVGNLRRVVANTFTKQGANPVLLDIRPEDLVKRYGAETPQRLFTVANFLDVEGRLLPKLVKR